MITFLVACASAPEATITEVEYMDLPEAQQHSSDMEMIEFAASEFDINQYNPFLIFLNFL